MMTSMLSKAVELIKKPSSERTSGEVELIAPWLRKKTRIFQGLESESLVQIVRKCEYRQAKNDEVLIKQGEQGDCLFIILNGSVSVYVDSSKTGEEDFTQLKPRTPAPVGNKSSSVRRRVQSQTGARLPSLPPSRQAPSRSRTQSFLQLDRSKFGKLVVKFDAGKCFGEIALISEDSARNATIINDGLSDLLLIRKSLYDETLKDYQEKEFRERRNFVSKHPLFRNWQPRFKRLLEMSLVKEFFPFGAQLLKQGDHVGGLMFILKGRARILTEPSRHNQQYSELHPFSSKNDVYEIEFNRPQRAPPEHPEEILRWEHIEVRRTEGYAAAEKRRFHREIPVCIVEEGEILGDLEILFNLNTHSVSAVCMAPVELFVLTSKNIERLVTKRNPSTMDILRMEVETKLRNRLQTQQGAEVFLYRHLFFKLTEEIRPTLRKTPDFGVSHLSKGLPDEKLLFEHLMVSFQDNKAEAVIPYVEGSVFLREKMREKARLRHVQSKIAFGGKQKGKIQTRSQSPKPRSIKHLKIALKKQDETARETEREYLTREYSLLEKEVQKEFFLNALASLNHEKDEEKGMQVICARLHQAEASVAKQPTYLLDHSLAKKPFSGSTQTPDILKHQLFVTDLNQSEPDLLGAGEREKTILEVLEAARKGTKSAEPTTTEIDDLITKDSIWGSEDKDESLTTSLVPPLNATSEILTVNEAVGVQSPSQQAPIQSPSGNTKRFKHLQSILKDKVALGPEDHAYRDWETSDKSLRYLEERIRDFKVNREPTFVKLPPLKRYQVGNSTKQQPHPGGHVLIRRKVHHTSDTSRIIQYKHGSKHKIQKIPPSVKLKQHKMLNHFALDEIRQKWLDQHNRKLEAKKTQLKPIPVEFDGKSCDKTTSAVAKN